MRVMVPEQGHIGVVQGCDVVGVIVVSGDREATITAGACSTRRLDILHPDTAIKLEWPRSGFMNVRLGAMPPALHDAREEKQE